MAVGRPSPGGIRVRWRLRLTFLQLSQFCGTVLPLPLPSLAAGSTSPTGPESRYRQ